MKLSNSPGANFTLNPLAWLAVSFAAGIISAGYLGLSLKFCLALSLFSGPLVLIFTSQKTKFILLFVAFAAAGGVHFSVSETQQTPNRLGYLYDSGQIVSGDPLELEGDLSAVPEAAVGGVFIHLRADTLYYRGLRYEVSGNVRFFAYFQDDQMMREYAQKDLTYGSRIRIAGNPRREDNFLNPGVVPRRKILDRNDLDAVGTVKSPLLIEKLGESRKTLPLQPVFEFRKLLTDEISETFDSGTAGVLNAALLGNKNFLDKHTAEVFREGGTFHVLVISGLHITFIGGLAFFFAGLLTRKRSWQFMLTAGFIWIYALGVGAGLPVVRASLMLTVLLFSRVMHRTTTLANALGLSVLVLLIWRPADVFDQSFQLTVTSMAAIIGLAFPLIGNLRMIGLWTPSVQTPFPPRVPEWLKRFCELIYWNEAVWNIESKRNIWSARLFKLPFLPGVANSIFQGTIRYAFEGAVVSAAVQIWLLPLLIYYFHRISFSSILLNLWVSINLAIESLTAFAGLLLLQISPKLGQPLINITELLNWFLIAVPEMLIGNNLASARIPIYSGGFSLVYVFYFVPLVLLTLRLNKWNPFLRGSHSRSVIITLVPSFLLLAGLILFHPFSTPSTDGRLSVSFLDVGQGDAALITFPNGQTMLIDGGGRMNFKKLFLENGSGEQQLFEPDSRSIGEAVVSEFLWEKGYSAIDYILATHADADHIQGLTDVARNFAVGKALFGRTPADNEEFDRLFEVLESRSIPAELIGRGDKLEIGGVRLEFLYPEKTETRKGVSENNNSVVVRLVFGGRKILLTGDIEAETERLLLQNSVLRADVVKVAHHGSRTSSLAEFIEKTGAVYAVIPVGRESPFGHPHPDVVQRWVNSGARVLTTGEKGTITISTDGSDLRIETFLKNPEN